MIKVLAFDWDDVFTLGAKEGYFACYHKALDDVEVYLEPEEEKKRILAKWSKPYREELKELLKEKPELVDKACKMWEKEYWSGTFINSLSLLPGVNDLLIRLKEKYILVVATGNQPKMLLGTIFPKFKIPQVFSQILSSHEISDPEKMKPHPFMLHEIMKKYNVKPSEMLYIGDAKTDVLMAQSAEVIPVAVLTGHLNRKEAESLNVQYIIEKVTDLEGILETFK